VHHEVVHVDDQPSFRKVVGENVVHECLKHRWRIALAKEHHRWFIQPIRGSESSLPLVCLLNPNIVISPSDIKFHEVAGVFESVDEVGDTRKRIGVLDRMRIDVSIVLAGTKCSICFRDKEERGCLQGF